jgi:hypothetical protein
MSGTTISEALLLLAVTGAGLTGCSDPVTTAQPVIAIAAVPATTGQAAVAGTILPQPLTVEVSSDGQPAAGVTVSWEASAGTLGRSTSVTGADGLTTAAWTLGADTGMQTATAAVAAAQGSPATFSARALAPPEAAPPPETPPPPVVRTVSEVFVRPDVWQVRPGERYRLTAIPLDGNGVPFANPVVTWASQHAGIATVSSTGLLTGVAPGSTTITATSDGVAGTIAVTVLGPIVTVTLIPTPAAIAVGDETRWAFEARDARGTRMLAQDATWSSSKPGIAFAEVHGRLIGIQPGTADIAATVEGVTGKAVLTVVPPLDLSGDWSMEEEVQDPYFPCAASGPVVVDQEQASASVSGTYHRSGSCTPLQNPPIDIGGTVAVSGTIAGSSVSLEGSATTYHCAYRGAVIGGSSDRIEGTLTCAGLPGTPQENLQYDGTFAMTR